VSESILTAHQYRVDRRVFCQVDVQWNPSIAQVLTHIGTTLQQLVSHPFTPAKTSHYEHPDTGSRRNRFEQPFTGCFACHVHFNVIAGQCSAGLLADRINFGAITEIQPLCVSDRMFGQEYDSLEIAPGKGNVRRFNPDDRLDEYVMSGSDQIFSLALCTRLTAADPQPQVRALRRRCW
jgi:hypothetical protein